MYEDILNSSRTKLFESISSDLRKDDFNWSNLIELILDEESPLLEVFSDQTVKTAEFSQAANRLFDSACDLERSDEGDDTLEEENTTSDEEANKEYGGFDD